MDPVCTHGFGYGHGCDDCELERLQLKIKRRNELAPKIAESRARRKAWWDERKHHDDCLTRINATYNCTCTRGGLFEQNVRWIDRVGKVWLLEEMEPSHRANLLGFLRDTAPKRYRADNQRAAMSMNMWHGGDPPDGVFVAMSECEAIGLSSLDDQAVNEMARDWIENTPLVKRLHELVAQDKLEALRSAIRP